MRASNGQFLKGTHWRPRAPHWDAEWLRAEYEVKERSTSEIAAGLGITENGVCYWLAKHGIKTRSVSEARAKKHWGLSGPRNPMYGRRGKDCPTYIDGSSPERQRLYGQVIGREFLCFILARDSYRCLRCGAGKTGKRSLHVHHVKPWAGNPELRFDPSNVVTLCRKCHHWVHSKRNLGREFLA